MTASDGGSREYAEQFEVLREVQISHQAEYWELHRTEYEAYAAAYAELLAARESSG